MKIVAWLLLVIISFASASYPQAKTFIREYTYRAGEADSKITSRAIALDQLKRLLLEEVGIYINSIQERTQTDVNNQYQDIYKQQTTSITAGVTETKILEEKWNGEMYYIRAQVIVDPEEVNKKIAQLVKNRDNVKDLEALRESADSVQKVILKLKEELATARSDTSKAQITARYDTFATSLSLTDDLRRAKYYIASQQYDSALALYNNIHAKDPNNTAAISGLGNLFVLKKDPQNGIKFYTEWSSKEPNNVKPYFNIGQSYFIMKDYNKAIEYYQKVLSMTTDLTRLSEVYTFIGYAYFNKKDYANAIIYLEKAIPLKPNDSAILAALGAVYLGKGDQDQAVKYLHKAADLGNDNARNILKQLEK